MTPLEKAAEALSATNDPHVKDWARQVIRAFLEAAAEDERLGLAFAMETHRGGDWGMRGEDAYEARKEYWHAMSRAHLLALKETING